MRQKIAGYYHTDLLMYGLAISDRDKAPDWFDPIFMKTLIILFSSSHTHTLRLRMSYHRP